MIGPSTFVERWQKRIPEDTSSALLERRSLIRVSPEALTHRDIPEASKRFLSEAGLPRSAAPYLSFDDLCGGLRHIWETWGVPDDWDESDRLRLNRYYVIGSEGSGNPICIDVAEGGRVIELEHEDWFSSMTFVNSSVPQLAEFLLLFNGADTTQEIVSELKRVDHDAMEEGCFWRYEVDAAAGS